MVKKNASLGIGRKTSTLGIRKRERGRKKKGKQHLYYLPNYLSTWPLTYTLPTYIVVVVGR